MTDTDKQSDAKQPEVKPGEAQGASDPKAAPAAKGKKEAKFVRYVTREKWSVPTDIQIRGQILYGQWSHAGGHVEWDVPVELVEAFEMHHHFVVGNVVRKPEDKPAEKSGDKK